MSGSGSGGGGSSWNPGDTQGAGSGGAQPSCYSLVERAHVSSPDPDVVQNVRVNDILDVALDQDDTPLLLLKTSQGQILGSVVPSKMAQIIACILSEGVAYMAIVLEKVGGLIKVEIRAKE